MTVMRNKLVPMLIVGAIALAGTACTKDKMMGDGNMMNDSGTMNKMEGDTMNKKDTGKKKSSDDGMM